MTQSAQEPYTPPISVIATGASTAVGYNAAITAASVRAGITRFIECPDKTDAKGNPVIYAPAQYLPDGMNGIDRLCELTFSAVNEALEPIDRKIDLPVIVGLPVRPVFTDESKMEVTERFKNYSHTFCTFTSIETVCTGTSAGLMALEKGCEMIAKGDISLCLVGGIDSWINQNDLDWLDDQEMLFSSENPWGFIPGEGAGFCLLASEDMKAKLGTSAKAHILSGATALEENLINTDAVCTGEGLSQAINLVLQDSDPPESKKVDQIICDLNGLRYKADEFGFTILKTAKRFKKPDDFMAPASFLGDVGAASGPIFITLAIDNGLHGYQTGPLNLVLTGSDQGERSALLLNTLNPDTSK